MAEHEHEVTSKASNCMYGPACGNHAKDCDDPTLPPLCYSASVGMTKQEAKPGENENWYKCRKLQLVVEYRDMVPGETITTIEGVKITLGPEHVVMRGTRGELYPITKAIFNETYEVAGPDGSWIEGPALYMSALDVTLANKCVLCKKPIAGAYVVGSAGKRSHAACWAESFYTDPRVKKLRAANTTLELNAAKAKEIVDKIKDTYAGRRLVDKLIDLARLLKPKANRRSGCETCLEHVTLQSIIDATKQFAKDDDMGTWTFAAKVLEAVDAETAEKLSPRTSDPSKVKPCRTS